LFKRRRKSSKSKTKNFFWSEAKNRREATMVSSGKALLAVLVAVSLTFSTVSAWGGLFNRFNPSMLSNLGFGGNYGQELFGAAEKNEAEVHRTGANPAIYKFTATTPAL
jgi:hypothetical protein